jgi:hypothetical protein
MSRNPIGDSTAIVGVVLKLLATFDEVEDAKEEQIQLKVRLPLLEGVSQSLKREFSARGSDAACVQNAICGCQKSLNRLRTVRKCCILYVASRKPRWNQLCRGFRTRKWQCHEVELHF